MSNGIHASGLRGVDLGTCASLDELQQEVPALQVAQAMYAPGPRADGCPELRATEQLHLSGPETLNTSQNPRKHP